MTYLVILAAIAVLLSGETVWLAVRDGRGPQRPPRSHLEDPRFHSPACRADRAPPIPDDDEGPVTLGAGPSCVVQCS